MRGRALAWPPFFCRTYYERDRVMDLVPERFVDAFGEISLKHGMIRIELVSLSGPEPRVTQRLITSLQAFRQMLQAQNGMIEQLQKAGVVQPSISPPAVEAESHPNPPPRAGEGMGGGGVVAAVRRLARIEPVPQPAAPPAAPAAATALGPPKSPNFSDEP
jgi:hypothetical protein